MTLGNKISPENATGARAKTWPGLKRILCPTKMQNTWNCHFRLSFYPRDFLEYLVGSVWLERQLRAWQWCTRRPHGCSQLLWMYPVSDWEPTQHVASRMLTSRIPLRAHQTELIVNWVQMRSIACRVQPERGQCCSCTACTDYFADQIVCAARNR